MPKEMKKYQQRIIGRVKKLSKKDYAALQDFMETSAARIVRGVLGEELFDGMDVDQYRKGGIVKKSEGGKVQKTGFVEGSPDNYAKGDTVADTVKTQVREGSFVINAPTVERLQQAGMLPKGVDNSDKNATIKANKGGLMDVALSKGEYVIEPEEAQRIGYSFLEKINDQGKAEVDRRQGMNQGGPAGTDLSGIPPLAAGLRPAIRTDTKPEGFIATPPPMPDTPIPSRDEDTFFNTRFGDIKDAIKNVEIKGFEKDPYIRTGASRGKAKSSAFGPMQLTYTTLEDFKNRSPEYGFLSDEDKVYVDDLIQQGRDFVNYQKSGAIFRDGKRVNISAEQAKKLKAYGSGTIDRARHEKSYDVVADMVLRLKLSDHNTLKEALASYGEGADYAEKVLAGLN